MSRRMAIPSTISPLTSTNWHTWKTDIKVLLIHFGCWEFIEDIKKLEDDIPSVSEENATEKSTTKTESSPKLSYRDQLDYQLRKNRSFTLIYKNVSNELKPLISDTIDGSEAWNILKERFEPVNRARVVQLLNEFFECRYIPGENVALFVCRVKAAVARLREAGHTIEDILVGFQLIKSLPEEFQIIVREILRWPDEDFIPSKIEDEIILQASLLESLRKDLKTTEVPFYEKQQTFETFHHCCPRRKTEKTISRGCAREQTSRPLDIGSTSFLSKPTGNPKKGPCYKCKRFGHIAVQCKVKMTML